MADDYEIVPEKDFDSLKTEVDKLKKDPIGNSVQGNDLKESIDNLTKSINGLMDLFKTTADNLKMEEHDNGLVSQRIGPLFKQIDILTDQNEKIAKGIVALAEMVDELKSNAQKPPAQKAQSQMPKITPMYPSPPIKYPFEPQSINLENSKPIYDKINEPLGKSQSGPSPLPRTEIPKMPDPPQQQKKKGLFGLGR